MHAPEYLRAFNLHEAHAHAFTFAKENQCFSIHPNVDLLKSKSDTWIAEAHKHELRVHPYVINDENLANALLANGIDGFFTDSVMLYGPEFLVN